jgi:hypothetical protein
LPGKNEVLCSIPIPLEKKKRRRKEETADLELWVGFWEEPGARIL